MFDCDKCDSKFKKHHQLLRHQRLIHENKVYGRNEQPSKYFQCTLCFKYFFKQQLYQTHIRKCKSYNNKCQNCGKYFLNKDTLILHNLRCVNQEGFGNRRRLPVFIIKTSIQILPSTI